MLQNHPLGLADIESLGSSDVSVPIFVVTSSTQHPNANEESNEVHQNQPTRKENRYLVLGEGKKLKHTIHVLWHIYLHEWLVFMVNV